MRVPPKGTRARDAAELDVRVRQFKRAAWAALTPPLERIVRWLNARLPS